MNRNGSYLHIDKVSTREHKHLFHASICKEIVIIGQELHKRNKNLYKHNQLLSHQSQKYTIYLISSSQYPLVFFERCQQMISVLICCLSYQFGTYFSTSANPSISYGRLFMKRRNQSNLRVGK